MMMIRAVRCCSAAWLALASLAACSPALDWREFVPEGGELSITLPCRPDRHARIVSISGAKVEMTMLVCSAGEATYAVSYFDVTDPARVSPALAEWRAVSVANVKATMPAPTPLPLRGATPNDQAGRIVVEGRLPDGAVVQEHAAFFVRGLRVYAATVIGAKPSPQAVEVFFGGLKFPG
jgi:hypothetical protein